MHSLSPHEIQFIRDAARYLETPNLIHRLGQVIGRPIDKGLDHLPASAKRIIHRASQKAIDAALRASLATLGEPGPRKDFPETIRTISQHKLAHGASSALTGAIGGIFGLASFAIELPITTTLMLRSISQIASDFGENLSTPEAQLECLYVFSLGGPAPSDDEAESAYYAGRVAFSQMVTQALHFLGGKSTREILRAVEKRSAPVLIELIFRVAGRFEINVGRKALSQLIPGIGAGLGALINVAFMEHFNQTAKFHFGLRRLEREHGIEPVRSLYRECVQEVLRSIAG